MADFQYKVIDSMGKEKKGTIEGDSIESVTSTLKAEGNTIIEVTTATMLNKEISLGGGSGGKIKVRDYSIFCRQIVSILGAGVSVIEALHMLAEQTENKVFQAGIYEVYDDLSKGELLSVAMRRRKKVFPEMLCNMIEAGEASGSLEVAFERMAVQFEKDAKLQATVKKAMIYPIVVISVLMMVMVAMLVIVIPSFMEMFEDLDTELPMATQLVVKVSDLAVAYWPVVLIAAIAAAFAFKSYAKSESGKYTLDGYMLKIPILGPLVQKSACARLGRTLCTLLSAGVPLLEAIEITGKSMDNVRYKEALYETKDQIGRGVTLSKPLKTCGLFPPMVIHMVTIGENTGRIEGMLENIADYYEEDVQNATEQLTAVIEPLVIVLMAFMVGFLIITILSPMMTLYDTLG